MPKVTLIKDPWINWRAKYNRRTFTSVGEFGAVVQEAVKAYQDSAALVLVRAVFDLAEAIRLATPVDTTRCRANWHLGLNGMPEGFDPDARDTETDSVDDEPILEFKIGDRMYIYNKTPYVGMLEAGWSPQAPPGAMVRLNRMRWRDFVHEAAQQMGLA